MKRPSINPILIFCVCCGLMLPASRSSAFALLGPYESWMQPSNGFRAPTDYFYSGPGVIGGPMCISNGYRWNVPVVTYGFAPSFLSFFGTNGVAAVEGAIQTLNDLPPASATVLSNYPNYSLLVNAAASQSLYDLKSQTLSLLLEHLGLASPTRYIYVLRQWGMTPQSDDILFEWTPQYIVMRNYDPLSFIPTEWVNGSGYEEQIWSGYPIGVNLAEFIMLPGFSETPPYSAVADNRLNAGDFYTGLTSDDVGGLCYLFSINNVNYETLLPGVSGIGANSNVWVNGALRPGIDKITFVPHPSSSGGFLPMTNQYTDTYITNGTVIQQQVQRVITQPDFLFCVGDTGKEVSAVLPFARTGTSNWINNAASNGRASGAGPGVIQPPVKITFANLGQALFTWDQNGVDEQQAFDGSSYWATYDQSTNAPVVYPEPQSGTNQLNTRIWFTQHPYVSGQSVELSVTAQAGKPFLLQTSSNLNDWISLGTNQVNGAIWTLFDDFPSSQQRFFRLFPQ